MSSPNEKPFLVVVAADKFRGTLKTHELEWSLARGASRAGDREAEWVRAIGLRMSDGGEGFADAAAAAFNDGQSVSVNARSALGESGVLSVPALGGWRPMPNLWWLLNRGVMPYALLGGPLLVKYLHPAWIVFVLAAAFVPLLSIRLWWKRETLLFHLIVPAILFLAGLLTWYTVKQPPDKEALGAAATGLSVLAFILLFTWCFPAFYVAASRCRAGTIVLESAILIGHDRVTIRDRDPERLTTVGVGDAIRGSFKARAAEVVVGLGGSLTVDGGIGLAAAYGYRFLNQRGEELQPLGTNLERIATIVKPKRFSKDWRALRTIKQRSLIAACDVMAPLIGEHGAARLYAPQKGASEEAVERLEAGLANLRQRCVEAGLITPDQLDRPGDGAAGGLGFGMRVFLGARLTSGAALIADWNRLSEAIQAADLVLTGEGSADEQTLQGKVVAEVVRRAGAIDKPVGIICGRAVPDAHTLEARLRTTLGQSRQRVFTVLDRAEGDEPMANRFAADLVTELACEAVKAALTARRRNEPLWPAPEPGPGVRSEP